MCQFAWIKLRVEGVNVGRHLVQHYSRYLCEGINGDNGVKTPSVGSVSLEYPD